MELNRIALLFLIACTLQVGAFPDESDGAVRKQRNNKLSLADVDKSITNLKYLYDEAITTLDKFQSCGTGTHLEMLRLADQKLSDYQGCVNATREIANYEEFLIHFCDYIKIVVSTFINLVKEILDCRHQPGIFAFLNCTVTEIQISGPEFDEILIQAKELIAEVETDTDYLVLYIKRCFGRSTSEFITEIHSLIKNNC